MTVAFDQLINHVKNIDDWRADWERRWDAAVARRWLDDALRALEAEGERIQRKQIAIARRIGCLGTPQKESQNEHEKS